MQIVHVIRQLDPRTGGPPVVLLELAAAQAALGHAVHVVYGQVPEHLPDIQKLLNQIPGTAALKLHPLSDASGRSQSANEATQIITQLAAAGPTVAHLHGVWEPMLAKVASAMRAIQQPYVICPHGLLDPFSLSQKRWKKIVAMTVFARKMLNGAAFLHALNSDERQLLAPLGLKCPVEIIPNGIQPGVWQSLPPRGSFRAKIPAAADRNFFLFLGRLHFKKGLDILAEAFALYAKSGGTMDLVVAGPDDGALTDLRQRIAAHKLESRIHIVGPLYGPEKLAAFADASAFVLTSRQEGFSIAITEALAAALPVVISPECHFPEVAAENAGLIVPLDPASTARALTQISTDPTAAKHMGEAGRGLVYQHYTWPKIAERSIELYQRALAKS